MFTPSTNSERTTVTPNSILPGSLHLDLVEHVGWLKLVAVFLLLCSFASNTYGTDSKPADHAWIGKQVVPKCPYIGFRVGKKIVDINHWRMPVFRVEAVKGNELRLSCKARKGEEAWVAADEVVELEDALVLYSINIQAFPDDLNSKQMRGLIWLALKDVKKAEAEFTALNEVDDPDFSYLLVRGGSRVLLKQYDLAIKDFDAVIKLDPDEARAYASRGFVRAAQREFRQAIEDYDRDIELEPDLPQLHYYRGCAWAELEDLDRAIAEFAEAIRRDPHHFQAYHARGFTYLKRKEYDKAIADLDESIRLEPKNSGAWVDRGRAWFKKGESEKGLANIEEALRLNPADTRGKEFRVYGLKWRGRDKMEVFDFDGGLTVLLYFFLFQVPLNK